MLLITTVYNLHIDHNFTSANPYGDRERTFSKNVLKLKLGVELLPQGKISVRTPSSQGTRSTEKGDLCSCRQHPHTTTDCSRFSLSLLSCHHNSQMSELKPQVKPHDESKPHGTSRSKFSEGLLCFLLA